MSKRRWLVPILIHRSSLTVLARNGRKDMRHPSTDSLFPFSFRTRRRLLARQKNMVASCELSIRWTLGTWYHSPVNSYCSSAGRFSPWGDHFSLVHLYIYPGSTSISIWFIEVFVPLAFRIGCHVQLLLEMYNSCDGTIAKVHKRQSMLRLK